MLSEHNRADGSEAKVFDLMIHGICRGWLPAPEKSASAKGEFEFEGMDLSPTAGHGSGVSAFARGVPAIVVMVAIAIIASSAIGFVGVGDTATSAVPHSARHAATADDPGARAAGARDIASR